jgi:hypothetical protein
MINNIQSVILIKIFPTRLFRPGCFQEQWSFKGVIFKMSPAQVCIIKSFGLDNYFR